MSRPVTVTFDLETLDVGDLEEIFFNHVNSDREVEINYTPGDPGRLSGPPEDCYPPEDPEWELAEGDNSSLALQIVEPVKALVTPEQFGYLVKQTEAYLSDLFDSEGFNEKVREKGEEEPDDGY